MSTSGNPTALPNFAQLFTADPTYKNFMGLNQQFSELTNAFGRGNSPFSLQDIQGAASAFQQATQPYAQQFQEQSSQEVLARRAAAQQQQQQQLRLQMQNALGPGAVIQGNVTAPVSPFQQQAASIPLNRSPLSSASSPYTNTRSTFSQPSPYGSGYGSMGGGFGGNQNVIPLEGRFGLVRLAEGGEVSEARRMLQNLQNPVQRFAEGSEVSSAKNNSAIGALKDIPRDPKNIEEETLQHQFMRSLGLSPYDYYVTDARGVPTIQVPASVQAMYQAARKEATGTTQPQLEKELRLAAQAAVPAFEANQQMQQALQYRKAGLQQTAAGLPELIGQQRNKIASANDLFAAFNRVRQTGDTSAYDTLAPASKALMQEYGVTPQTLSREMLDRMLQDTSRQGAVYESQLASAQGDLANFDKTGLQQIANVVNVGTKGDLNEPLRQAYQQALQPPPASTVAASSVIPNTQVPGTQANRLFTDEATGERYFMVKGPDGKAYRSDRPIPGVSQGLSPGEQAAYADSLRKSQDITALGMLQRVNALRQQEEALSPNRMEWFDQAQRLMKENPNYQMLQRQRPELFNPVSSAVQEAQGAYQTEQAAPASQQLWESKVYQQNYGQGNVLDSVYRDPTTGYGVVSLRDPKGFVERGIVDQKGNFLVGGNYSAQDLLGDAQRLSPKFSENISSLLKSQGITPGANDTFFRFQPYQQVSGEGTERTGTPFAQPVPTTTLLKDIPRTSPYQTQVDRMRELYENLSKRLKGVKGEPGMPGYTEERPFFAPFGFASGGSVDKNEKSEARRMLQNLSSPVQHFASGSEVSAGLQYARENFGPNAESIFNQNIRDFLAKNPDETATRAAMAQYGISESDVRNATGRGLQEFFVDPGQREAARSYVAQLAERPTTSQSTAAAALAELADQGTTRAAVEQVLPQSGLSAASQYALFNTGLGAAGAPGQPEGGIAGMDANIRAAVEGFRQQNLTSNEAAQKIPTAMRQYGISDVDIQRATGQSLADLVGSFASSAPVITKTTTQPAVLGSTTTQPAVLGSTTTQPAVLGSTTTQPIILPPITALPPLTEVFVKPTAPLPEAPPVAMTAGQEGLDPSTAIVKAIPQSERVTIPQLDTEFRASAPRTPTYDRFGRITGYTYSPAAKLTPATGTNVFNFVPPGITSRPRSLLNLGDVPGVMVDPVTGQMRLPLSASQQFARDRSTLDNQFRQLYARAAAGDKSLPAQAPTSAAAAFRDFVMSGEDPMLQNKLRFRDIEQQKYDPTKADPALRVQYGQSAFASDLAAAFDPFLARNRAALTSLAEQQTPKSYSEMYPDIAAAYAKLSDADKAKFPTLRDYELYHFDTYGRKEGRTSPLLGMGALQSPYAATFLSKGGEASTEDFIKKQSGGDVSRETASPNTAEVPKLTSEGQLIDENAEMRSESQRMLNRLKMAQQENYRRGKLPPGIQRAVTDVMSEEKPPLIRGKAIQTAGDIVGGLVSATPREPTNPSEAYRLMQGFTGAYLPTAPVVRTAQAVKTAVQEPRATMSAARQSLEALGDIPVALAQPNQLGSQAGAVRPYGKGTVFSGVKLANDRYVGSSLDDYIDQGKSAAFRTSDVVKADAIQKFFDTKARRYMSTQLGTERDPVFDAIKKGRISNLALHDIQGLRKYAIEAAREGKYKVNKETGENVLDQYGRPIFYPKDLQAVVDVTKAYDEMVDVKPMSFKPGLIPQTYKTSDPAYMQEAERIREQMLQAFEAEGLDPRLVNLKSDPMILTSTRDTGEPYYPGYLYRMDDFIKDKLSGNPEAMKGVPENIRRALDQDELLYDVGLKRGPLEDILDPESMANYLATLSPKEIDKIRFEDAVVGSAKFNRERIDRKFEGLRLQELVKSGKAPDKVFSKGVSEPLLQFGEDQRHPGFAWKRIEDLEATIPEGAYVGHSVGGYALGGTGYGPSFTKGFQEGTHEIYSLRDARNRPVTTIQVIDYGDKSNPYRVVKQIKGNGAKTGNTAPVDYDVEVYDFLTQVVKPDAITESDSYLTPMLIQYRDALEANRQTR